MERHVLETMTFDFRAHHPQPYIIKFTKYLKRFHSTTYARANSTVPREVARQAWRIALDGYRTFAPLKYPPHILALGYIHLSALLQSVPVPLPYDRLAAKPDDVNAVMIDLLDLYIHHLAATHIGPQYPLTKFMELQISIRRSLGREADGQEEEMELPKEREASAGDRGTVRFILDRDRVLMESEILESLR